MDKLTIIEALLNKLGMPRAQQSKLCVLTILAMAQLKNSDDFINATNKWIRIHEIIKFINANYECSYAENSRETFRKQALHHFRTALIVEDNGQPTNSPNYRYRLTEDFLKILKELDNNSSDFSDNIPLSIFLQSHERLAEIYSSKKRIEKLPVMINSEEYGLSKGSHNLLQKAILEEFAPRFAPGAECLYVGDTTDKNLINKREKLSKLGFEINIHNKMPDVILYVEERDWLYFIEAVDSVGPMSPDRVIDINNMTHRVTSGKIFVTAFLTMSKYRRFVDQLAWETEVWIAESPDHMIHLNGNKFLGPRTEQ